MQLTGLTAILGACISLYGIYRIHSLKEEKVEAISSGSMVSKTSASLKWLYIAITMMGMASVWGSAATTVSVPASATITVKSISQGEMALGIEVKKQRDCPMDTLMVELDYQSGRREILIIDYAIDPGTSILETVVRREDKSAVTRVTFRASYICPFNIQVDSLLGSIKPPEEFNIVEQ